jgi:hypothetical protein
MARSLPQEPLEQVTHWRRLREIISAIMSLEKIPSENYDLDNIRCYRSRGSEMKGLHVTYGRADGRCCWVDDNYYDVYEIPDRSNTSRYEGEYIFLALNTYFGYYIAGWMSIGINKDVTRSFGRPIFNVDCSCYGQYSASIKDNTTYVTKMCRAEDFNVGYAATDSEFDPGCQRLIDGYHVTIEQVLSRITGERQNRQRFVDSKPVQIYHKRRSAPHKKRR